MGWTDIGDVTKDFLANSGDGKKLSQKSASRMDKIKPLDGP